MPITKPIYSRRTSRLLALIIAVLMLMLCMGIFTATALASEGDIASIEETLDDAPLIVNAAWLDGETIRIDVTDPQTGASSAIAVPLYQYLREGENIEFISIQAVDLNGRQSGVIEIRNPFFNPNLPPSNAESGGSDNSNNEQSVSVIEPPNSNSQQRPLTPDGTGTVIDNVTDGDGGREFFTIFSEDGSEFFLIIDRHRDTENVYFLNAVTIEDLMSLARDAGREIEHPTNNGTSAIQVPTQPNIDEQDSEDVTPTPEPDPADERPTALSRIGSNLLFFVGIIVVIGGLAYYLKVVRPKQSGFSDYGDEPDDYDYDNAVDEDADNTEDGDDD